MHPQSTRPRAGSIIRTINGVRGLAILLVFGVHLVSIGFLPLARANAHPVIKLLWLGWTGVDLFFVLSGFLITGILVDTRASANYFRSFYMRRILRIFPLYYLTVVLGFVGWLIFRHTSHWHHFLDPRTFSYLLLYLQNYHSVAPMYGHFWSLALEEQFYFLWPLIVFLVPTRRALAWTILSLIVASFVCRLLTVLHGGYFDLNTVLQYRADSLLMGALLSLVVRNGTALRRVLRLAPFAGLAGLLGFLWISFGTPYEWQQRSPYTGLYGFPCLALLFGSAILLAWNTEGTGSLADRLLCTRFLQFTGKYSYGLYVFHAPVLLMLYDALATPGRAHLLHGIRGILFGVAGLAVTYGVAYLSFTYYERPFLTLKDRFNARTRQHPTHPDFPERDRIPA